MTENEILKEAEVSFDKRLGTLGYLNRMNTEKPYKEGYLDCARIKENRILKLENVLERILEYVDIRQQSRESYEKFFDAIEDARKLIEEK